MLNTYEFTTCFYILGGICATNCIFGLMFKPLPKIEVNGFYGVNCVIILDYDFIG